MILRILLFILISIFLGSIQAAEKKDKNRYEDDDIKFRVVPRTPDSISAFYIGRGFPQAALDEIEKTCYITFLMRNKSNKILWLDLGDWRFSSSDKSFRRLTRDYWQQKWKALNIPMSYQSTFGWSLLPDERDLYPDEPVGGSVSFMYTDQPITVEARFRIGKDKNQGEKVLRFEQVRCVKK